MCQKKVGMCRELEAPFVGGVCNSWQMCNLGIFALFCMLEESINERKRN